MVGADRDNGSGCFWTTAGRFLLMRRNQTKRNATPLGFVTRQRSNERFLRNDDFAALRDALQIRSCDNRFHTETGAGPTFTLSALARAGRGARRNGCGLYLEPAKKTMRAAGLLHQDGGSESTQTSLRLR